MTRAGGGQLARTDFENAQPNSHEHMGMIGSIDLLVDPFQDLRRCAAHQGMVVDQNL